MKSNEFLSATLLDILFENRNKEYGAYQLRTTYNKRLTMAFAGTVTLLLLFIFFNSIGRDNSGIIRPVPVTDVNISTVEPEIKKPEPLPELPKPVQQKIATTQFTTIAIVKEAEVVDPVPEMEELVDTKIGLVDQAGEKDEHYIAPPLETVTTATVTLPVKKDDFDRFTKVEKEAQYPGGLEAWKKFLERNLNANVAADDGAAIGLYTVRVQFIVDKNGVVSDIKALDIPRACPGCGAEAVRVIRKSGGWQPAIQNGRTVNYQAIQTITFQVAE